MRSKRSLTSVSERGFLIILPHIVAQCVVEELPDSVRADNDAWDLDSAGFIDKMSNCFDFDLSKGGRQVLDLVQSYVREPNGWAMEVPVDAKESVILLSSGLIRRPALLLKNEEGKYDIVINNINKEQTQEEVKKVYEKSICHIFSTHKNASIRKKASNIIL